MNWQQRSSLFRRIRNELILHYSTMHIMLVFFCCSLRYIFRSVAGDYLILFIPHYYAFVHQKDYRGYGTSCKWCDTISRYGEKRKYKIVSRQFNADAKGRLNMAIARFKYNVRRLWYKIIKLYNIWNVRQYSRFTFMNSSNLEWFCTHFRIFALHYKRCHSIAEQERKSDRIYRPRAYIHPNSINSHIKDYLF